MKERCAKKKLLYKKAARKMLVKLTPDHKAFLQRSDQLPRQSKSDNIPLFLHLFEKMTLQEDEWVYFHAHSRHLHLHRFVSKIEEGQDSLKCTV